MTNENIRAAGDDIAGRVRIFYEEHPYPPPVDDLDAYRRSWDDRRRRADSHLFWPAEPYRDNRSILVAGCGTTQAAHYALRWPRACVTGIDVSENSIAFTQTLKAQYGLDNLDVRVLAVERVSELKQNFDHIVCTGVLHHLADPDAGLRALRNALEPNGAINLMVYAPYGRAGVYILQEYCRRLGIGWTIQEIRDLAETLRAVPEDHPIAHLLRDSPDFANMAGVADALLNPRDRAYSVPQLMEFLNNAGLSFDRWLRQAPYSPSCGAPASTPHKALLTELSAEKQYAAIELFRGTMLRHSVIAYRSDAPTRHQIDFDGDSWPHYVPIRLPDTLELRDGMPAGASAVLVNRAHAYRDLYLPIDAHQEKLLAGIDGKRTIQDIGGRRDRDLARRFFEKLWLWDQIACDASLTFSSTEPNL